MTECLIHDIRQSWQWFLSSESNFTAVQKKCATPSHIHPASRYVIACDQFCQTFPHKPHAGVRGPGYKATLVDGFKY